MARGWAGRGRAGCCSPTPARAARPTLAAELGGEARRLERRAGRARRPRRARGEAGALDEVAAELARRRRSSRCSGRPRWRGSTRPSRRRRDPGDAERRGRGAPGRALRRRRGAARRSRELLELLGHVVELPTRQFDAATAVMGCAPAYLALAVEALADAGADAGLDPELARELVVETTAGTAELLRIAPPADVRGAVASPGRQHRGRPRGARPRGRARGLRGRRAGLAGEDAGLVIPLALTRGDVADYVERALPRLHHPDPAQHPDLAGCRGCPSTAAGSARCSTSSPRPPTPTSTSSAASCRRSAAAASRSTSARWSALIVLFVVEAVVVGLIRG